MKPKGKGVVKMNGSELVKDLAIKHGLTKALLILLECKKKGNSLEEAITKLQLIIDTD